MGDAMHNSGAARQDHPAELWKRALDKVVPACVVLRVTQARPLDTESAGSSYATGFIVDKIRGLILTNRHVVTPGPTTSEAILLNREEVPVRPIYYDPVHDFAFMQFDPSRIKFMELHEVQLAPEAAAVGLEIRVVGNDSGEKVSILAGTLARIDRDAPVYGRKGYNDFNTFYLQAASGTKGGSSGSPVIDCMGRAVGLNAGSKNKAASAFYLPLERVVRALGILQGCKDLGTNEQWSKPCIKRGDLQTTFLFKGFDEVRRLGLNMETEETVRSVVAKTGESDGPATGMLVVDIVLPGGPADKFLQAGDVLVKMEGRVLTHFLPMEEILDDNVGGAVTVEIDRGGKKIVNEIEVTDIHQVTPSCFLEFCGSSIHALSYQQARNHGVKTGQVYVAEPGYVLNRARIPKHAVVTKLDNVETPDMETFAGILMHLRHGARVPIEYYTFCNRHRKKNAILQMDEQWYGEPVIWSRDDSAGVWTKTKIHDYLPTTERIKMEVDGEGREDSIPVDMKEVVGVDGIAKVAEFEARMKRALTLVDVDIPLLALSDGVHSKNFTGTGLVVHHTDRLGLVIVDRNTVAIGPCDVMLSFGAHPAEISAKVRFLHPLHNFAIVSYDPSELPEAARTSICAAEILASPNLKSGDTVTLVGLTDSLQVMQRRSTVTNATLSISISPAEIPRYRAVHEEVIKLDEDFGSKFPGVLTDQEGRVRALWGSFSEQVDREEREWCAGLHSSTFSYWVEKLRHLDDNPLTPPPVVWVLNAELMPLLLSKAAHLGLPPAWISRLSDVDPERRQAVTVRGCVANSHASEILKDNDMILAVDSKPVSCFADIEQHVLQRVEEEGPTHVLTPSKQWSQEVNTSNCVSPRDKEDEDPHSNGAIKGKDGDQKSTSRSHSLQLTIFRNRMISDVNVLLGYETGMAPERLVHWCGALLQAPHRAVRELGFMPKKASGVYVSRWHHGSPAQRYGLYALHWIVELNGIQTPTLDSFLEIARELKNGEFVRVKLCHLETTRHKVLTIKLDLLYWPTWELRLDPSTCTWSRQSA